MLFVTVLDVYLSQIEGSRVCRDYQEVKIQEQVQKLTMGSIPRAILCILQDDLVDQLRVTTLFKHCWLYISSKSLLILLVDIFIYQCINVSQMSGW